MAAESRVHVQECSDYVAAGLWEVGKGYPGVFILMLLAAGHVIRPGPRSGSHGAAWVNLRYGRTGDLA